MLELKHIKKSYTTGTFTQHALKDVSLKFRKNEFVVILGPSGSGKTTMLNIIGGLDRYDSGDLVINGKSTTKFRETDWDSYRNNCIGFIFQSYNLISHISVLDNVEMGMTLSGINQKRRRKKALEVLERVGLKEHAHKKPNQLSGGQMQRVAIARALANNPDIILADEPTGALDSDTSISVMELIKEIAKEKLVIMVTHNPELAKKYATRIVEFKDGELLDDSNPVLDDEKLLDKFKIKRTAMNFRTALRLSFNNIKTKKGRTILTSFASSIGIIGIALILSLSNGFDKQIDIFERDTLSNMPIMVSTQAVNMKNVNFEKVDREEYTNKKEIYPVLSDMEKMKHTNNITDEYINYVKKIDKDLVSGITFSRLTNLNIITKVNDTYKPLGLNSNNFVTIPEKQDYSFSGSVIDNYYDLIYGKIPDKKDELLLIVDNKNQLDSTILEALGFSKDKDLYTFDDVLKAELKIVFNNDYYKNKNGLFTINTDLKQVYNSKNSMQLKIVGIIRGKEGKEMMTGESGLSYSSKLTDYVVSINKDSDIVKSQKKADYNILSNELFDDSKENTKENILGYLGSDTTPVAVSIYPKDFDSKEEILEYLDKYNESLEEEEKIIYNDYGAMISLLSGGIMSAITIVLIAFSSISLIVSSIMIGIITYISVLERTKEIGVLRSLGARKKDIKRVFTAETVIIGTLSGTLGIIIALILTIPTNSIIKSLTDLSNVARLNPIHAFILIIISLSLTVIGGLIPSNMASKRNPVEALRTE